VVITTQNSFAMDTNKQNGPSEEEERDESQEQHTEKRKSRSSVASINAIISSATENVHARRSGASHRLANTGTNISYEGPTAPGGGGSVGTGYSSGHSATGSGSRNDPAESARTHATNAPKHEKSDERTKDKENERDRNNDDPDHELIT
jgi:hypothetical protein